MSKQKGRNRAFEELNLNILQRGQRTIDKFMEVAVTGITQSGMRTILEDVKHYWSDTYRPALTQLSCEAVGGKPEAADPASLMITLAAVGSGIHDDIIDKSLNKHFRMTIPGIHGNDNALLVGDLLLIKALTAVRTTIGETCPQEKISVVLKAYEDFFLEVCEGEFMEITCRQTIETELDYHKQMLWKSTADTEACARLGAVLGGGSEKEVEALAEFGRRLGFIFRLVDDVKDSLNIEGNLPHRLQFESVPLPILYAAKSSNKNYSEIRSILEKSNITPPDVRRLLQICFDEEAFAYVLNLAKQNSIEATTKLRMLNPSKPRKLLSLMLKQSLRDATEVCL